jgi:hypothetical protein
MTPDDTLDLLRRPWYPVIPVKLVPSIAGGNTLGSSPSAR